MKLNFLLRNIVFLITGILAVLLVNIFNSFAALPDDEIQSRSKEILVQINGAETGSGFIIKKNRKSNIYTVLTNSHVVDKTKEVGSYQIITSDHKRHSPTGIISFKDVDLAVLQFQSSQAYPVAYFRDSNQLKVSNDVYVHGWADAFGESIPNATPQFFPAKVVTFVDEPKEGYSVAYDPPGTVGTSGGPVLDKNGLVIGINGGAERRTNSLNFPNRFLGLAIPINTFFSLAPQYGIEVRDISRDPPLISRATGVNYTSLRDLLNQERWQEADAETFKLILELTGRKNSGWLDEQSITFLACEDLTIIDLLWLRYSNSRFGLSLQREIWEKVGGKVGVGAEIYQAFAAQVGWKREFNTKGYISADDLNYSLDAPQGHLPASVSDTLENDWNDWGKHTKRDLLFSQAISCDI